MRILLPGRGTEIRGSTIDRGSGVALSGGVLPIGDSPPGSKARRAYWCGRVRVMRWRGSCSSESISERPNRMLALRTLRRPQNGVFSAIRASCGGARNDRRRCSPTDRATVRLVTLSHRE